MLPFCTALGPESLRPAGDEDRCCFRSDCRDESAEAGFIMVSEDQLILNIHPLHPGYTVGKERCASCMSQRKTNRSGLSAGETTMDQTTMDQTTMDLIRQGDQLQLR